MVIRRELRKQPDITLLLVDEALELAWAAPHLRLHLHPGRSRSPWDDQIRDVWIDEMSPLSAKPNSLPTRISSGRMPRRNAIRRRSINNSSRN